MKKIFFLSILLLFYSCNAQQQKIDTIKKDKTMKTFDIEKFNKNKASDGEYIRTTEDGTVIRQYKGDASYSEIITPNASLFETFNEYYNNGKLAYTVDRFYDIFTTGLLKEYDQQGHLIKKTNLEEPFPYSWEAVKKYLKEHGVHNLRKDINSIRRFNTSEDSHWELRFKGRYNGLEGEFFIELDGKTGEELLVKLFKGKGSNGKTGTIAKYEILVDSKREKNIFIRHNGNEYTKSEWEEHQKTEAYKQWKKENNNSIWNTIFGKKNN
ncbi:MAG: hypothetical protein JKY08_04800 [Flavobacteriaceae bacterium]|nr:hypothetical protein [Flavobacteriaceae bacterium]